MTTTSPTTTIDEIKQYAVDMSNAIDPKQQSTNTFDELVTYYDANTLEPSRQIIMVLLRVAGVFAAHTEKTLQSSISKFNRYNDLPQLQSFYEAATRVLGENLRKSPPAVVIEQQQQQPLATVKDESTKEELQKLKRWLRNEFNVNVTSDLQAAIKKRMASHNKFFDEYKAFKGWLQERITFQRSIRSQSAVLSIPNAAQDVADLKNEIEPYLQLTQQLSTAVQPPVTDVDALRTVVPTYMEMPSAIHKTLHLPSNIDTIPSLVEEVAKYGAVYNAYKAFRNWAKGQRLYLNAWAATEPSIDQVPEELQNLQVTIAHDFEKMEKQHKASIKAYLSVRNVVAIPNTSIPNTVTIDEMPIDAQRVLQSTTHSVRQVLPNENPSLPRLLETVKNTKLAYDEFTTNVFKALEDDTQIVSVTPRGTTTTYLDDINAINTALQPLKAVQRTLKDVIGVGMDAEALHDRIRRVYANSKAYLTLIQWLIERFGMNETRSITNTDVNINLEALQERLIPFTNVKRLLKLHLNISDISEEAITNAATNVRQMVESMSDFVRYVARRYGIQDIPPGPLTGAPLEGAMTSIRTAITQQRVLAIEAPIAVPAIEAPIAVSAIEAPKQPDGMMQLQTRYIFYRKTYRQLRSWLITTFRINNIEDLAEDAVEDMDVNNIQDHLKEYAAVLKLLKCPDIAGVQSKVKTCNQLLSKYDSWRTKLAAVLELSLSTSVPEEVKDVDSANITNVLQDNVLIHEQVKRVLSIVSTVMSQYGVTGPLEAIQPKLSNVYNSLVGTVYGESYSGLHSLDYIRLKLQADRSTLIGITGLAANTPSLLEVVEHLAQNVGRVQKKLQSIWRATGIESQAIIQRMDTIVNEMSQYLADVAQTQFFSPSISPDVRIEERRSTPTLHLQKVMSDMLQIAQPLRLFLACAADEFTQEVLSRKLVQGLRLDDIQNLIQRRNQQIVRLWTTTPDEDMLSDYSIDSRVIPRILFTLSKLETAMSTGSDANSLSALKLATDVSLQSTLSTVSTLENTGSDTTSTSPLVLKSATDAVSLQTVVPVAVQYVEGHIQKEITCNKLQTENKHLQSSNSRLNVQIAALKQRLEETLEEEKPSEDADTYKRIHQAILASDGGSPSLTEAYIVEYAKDIRTKVLGTVNDVRPLQRVLEDLGNKVKALANEEMKNAGWIEILQNTETAMTEHKTCEEQIQKLRQTISNLKPFKKSMEELKGTLDTAHAYELNGVLRSGTTHKSGKASSIKADQKIQSLKSFVKGAIQGLGELKQILDTTLQMVVVDTNPPSAVLDLARKVQDNVANFRTTYNKLLGTTKVPTLEGESSHDTLMALLRWMCNLQLYVYNNIGLQHKELPNAPELLEKAIDIAEVTHTQLAQAENPLTTLSMLADDIALLNNGIKLTQDAADGVENTSVPTLAYSLTRMYARVPFVRDGEKDVDIAERTGVLEPVLKAVHNEVKEYQGPWQVAGYISTLHTGLLRLFAGQKGSQWYDTRKPQDMQYKFEVEAFLAGNSISMASRLKAQNAIIRFWALNVQTVPLKRPWYV